MGLALVKQAADHTQPAVRRRGEAQLMRLLGEMVVRVDILVRVHQIAGIVVEIIAVAGERVVEIGIVGIVRLAGDFAVHIGAGIGDIEVADLALDGERALDPFVVEPLGVELHRLEIAEAGFDPERTVRHLPLAHDLRGDRPIVVEVDAQRGARAIGVDSVVIILDERGVVHRDPGGREGQAARDIVDIAGVMPVPHHEPRRDVARQRHVDEAFAGIAEPAVRNAVKLELHRAVDATEIGLVGDDADGARLARRAVQRALRPGQRLDPGDVEHVNVERALDGGDRLLVEIGADRRQ